MKMDSDKQSLKEKIDDLNQRAWDVRINDSPKAFELSKESVELARSIDYKEGLANGLRSLGGCYVRLAKNEEALPLLNESLSLFEQMNDLKGQAVVNVYLANVKRNQGDDLGEVLELFFKALDLSQKTGFTQNEINTYYQIGVTYRNLGNIQKALDYLYKSLASLKGDKDNLSQYQYRLFQSYPINIIGSIYFENGDYTRALEYYEESLRGRRESLDKLGEAGSLDNIGFTHFKLKNYQEAINYCQQSLAMAKDTGNKRTQSTAMIHLAEIYKQTGDIEKSTKFSNESLETIKVIGDRRREVEMLLFLADLQNTVSGNNKVPESLNNALKIAEELKMLDLLSQIRFKLSQYYKQQGNYEEALKQLELHVNLEKEFHKNAINQKVSNLEITYKAEEIRKEADVVKLKNEELTKLNKQIEDQKKKLEDAFADLKATQSQLIQSEKMASLGELTAGIAHEIQNPLNFVNNFSEVSNELIDEMNDELDKGDIDEAKIISNDIKQNLEKINHHGKRADAIVKSMLEHSRTSTGIKEPTDINKLADEYLRLAYHGLKAKDKSFNAEMKTDFDESIGKINIVPQDIGRVLVNLFNNAFYAVNQQKSKNLNSYNPTVWVNTKKEEDRVVITVKDNGNGIPEKIKEKIFQPFFTTKPTGSGTGLGLSLSYDIIKAHGGEFKVKSKEARPDDTVGRGEGSEFIIQLPAN